MSIKKGGCEDLNMMHFQDFYASPAKSDASSVDIYDGLDMELLREESPRPSSPSRDCLDLYEEILTEEGTAKEASFNDLSEEYEKCQRQMKQLIIKLKEMQSLNSSLQNENQCLKKNISALIKTARVEITRKEEEINRLNHRLFVPGNIRGVKPVPLLSMYKTKLKDDEMSKITRNMDSGLGKEVKAQVASCKDTASSQSPRNVYEKVKPLVENSSSCTSITPYVKPCKESAESHSQKPTLGQNPEVDDKKSRKEMDSEGQNKDTDRKPRKEGHRSSISSSTNENFDVKDKTCWPLPKCGKGEGCQENRYSKSDINYETDSRKYHSSSHDKLSSTKEKMHVREPNQSKEKHIKTREKSPRRRDSKTYEREKNIENRHRAAEKDDEPRRSKRTHFSNLKDESPQRSPTLEQNDGKRGSDAGRRDKRSSEYSESKYGNKDSKASKSETNTPASKNKHNHENKSDKSDRDRRGDEKKRSRDEQEKIRPDQKHRVHQKGEKGIHQSSSKDKSHDPRKANVKSTNCEEKDNSQKNLKLSFMETLNLTLSPVKKSHDTDPIGSTVSNMECDVNRTTDSSSQVCVSIENDAESRKHLNSPKQTDSRHKEPMSMQVMPSKSMTLDDSKLVFQAEPVVDTTACLQEQPATSTLEDSTALTKLTQESEQVTCIDLDAVRSEEMDTHSVVDESDFMALDSFIEIDRCSGSESPTPENLHVAMPAEQVRDGGDILEQTCQEVDNQTSSLKPNRTETTKGICESSNTDLVNVGAKGVDCKQCFHDEGSVLSIDLNFVRLIPKVISPLSSPVQPLAHLHSTERTAKASVVRVLYKDLPPDVKTSTPCLSLSKELNKENCQPDNQTNFGSGNFPIEISSDEVEEGEILTDEEKSCEEAPLSLSNHSQTDPDKGTHLCKSPLCQDNETVSLAKAVDVISPPKQPAPKIKKKEKHCTQAKKISASPNVKRRKLSADSCLEGVLKLTPPSSIQDVLQMLRIIRKHIRKKYMKFKIQFPVTQFHRIVEAATLCFVTLVSNLDWSNLCSSPQRLQNKLCKRIESRLKQMRKNGIVDRIFEQRLIDMKKRLWKFVEEQLDSLFETLKAVILKLCDKGKLEYDRDEQKISTTSCARTQKSGHLKNSQNKSNKFKTKACLAKSGSVSCLRRLEFYSQTNVSSTKPQTAYGTSVGKKILKDSTVVGSDSKNGITLCNNLNPTSKYSPVSPGKTVISPGHQKVQQNASGLSFNLVSDDHMGDIFKSLLHDSDHLELNTLQENLWMLGTPEKRGSSSQKYDDVDSLTENKTPIKTAFSWASISPPHIDTFHRLETILNPDVFDESCLLEIPCASNSKSIPSSEDRLKSYSSVLLDDLAVSLTVPSPLKSDSHLSFLRPDCDPESISEVNAHCSEDTVLDEEDATEQDIHLTLDSDNSSTGSLEDSGEHGSFQCHPSEPMQAVIMEKSNDHFIVKIRRAVSSSSPVSNCSSAAETDNAAPEQLECINHGDLCETIQGESPETETWGETQCKALSDSIMPCTDDSSFSEDAEKSVIAEKKLETFTGSQPNNSDPPDTMESVFKSPVTISQNVTCTLETQSDIEETDSDSAEKDQIDCKKSITSCSEKTICSPTASAERSPMKDPVADCMNLNLKKRKSSKEEPSAKRQRLSSPLDTKDKSKTPRHGKTEDEGKLLAMEKSHRKHRRAVSEGAINISSSKHSPSNLSAKNVIKKKGEVVASWTRDEDRAILLDCQKLGPNEKTFLTLSSKMNKYPYQVEERFRQLMKLFKKSRNSSS